MQCQRPSPWTYASGMNTYCRAWHGALQLVCGVCGVWRVRCAGVACAVCGVQRKAHHTPLWKLDLALGQVGRPAAWHVEAVSARVVQAVFGFECRNHYPCGGAAHSRLRIDPAGSSAEVGARLCGLTQHPAVVGHEDARALRCGCQDAHCERAPQQCHNRGQNPIQKRSSAGLLPLFTTLELSTHTALEHS
eukprot:scaffold19799_cov69-Phaeocystis_antarctica.AAC.1